MKYNNLLERQIKKHFPENVSLDDPGIAAFLNVINQSYQSFERDKSLSERASDINEEEYIEINKSLNEEINNRKSSIDNLKKTISLITDEPLDFSNNDLMSIADNLNKQVHSRKKAETIFTSLINNIQTGVLLKDLDNTIIFTNKLFCEIFEIDDDPKNIIDKNFNDFKSTILLKLKHPNRFKRDTKNKLAAKKIDLLNIIDLKDGRTLEQSYIPIIQENSCVGHLWNYSDITERKEKEETIRKNEILLTTSQEIAHIGSWEYNIITEKVEWTKEIYSIRGIDPETEKANYAVFMNGIHPEDKAMVNAKLMEAIKNTISFNIHYRIIKPDGDIRIVNDIGNTIVNAQGKNELIRGTIQDVTLRKKIEQEILQQKQFTEDILNNIPADIAVFDKNHNYLYINPKAIADKNMRDWMIGKNDFDYSTLKGIDTKIATKRRGYFNEAIETKISRDWVDEHTTKTGSINFIFRRFYPYYEDEELKFVIGYGIDITSRRKTEIELEGVMKSMARVNKELEQFAFSASHDLQEPLRMVTSFLAQLDKKYGDTLDEKGKTYLNFAVDGARRMRQMILDLLEYSRVDRLDDFELEEVDLNEVIDEIITLHQVKIQEKNANINIGKLPKLKIYRSPIRQVFQSFIDNSLKYSKEDVKPEISITSKEELTYWQFSITDNGIGIRSEYFEKIFVLFQRLHNREKYSGTGIGLSIAKKIIYNMNGEIWLESQENIGTTFHFTLLKK
ncbi:MAG: ATP-binding protein [Sediminibacterium sp.]